jgi:hypothetical protein
MIQKLLLPFVAFVLCCSAFAQSHPPISEMKVLFDPRTPSNTTVTLSSVETKSYLRQIEAGKHLSRKKYCPNLGVPILGLKIISIGNGSFTRANVKQQVVLYSLCDSRPDGPTGVSGVISGVSVFENGRMLTQQESTTRYLAVYGVKDFTKNGRSEILLERCVCWEGGTTFISIREFGSGRLRELAEVPVNYQIPSYDRWSTLYVHKNYPSSIFMSMTVRDGNIGTGDSEVALPWKTIRIR